MLPTLKDLQAQDAFNFLQGGLGHLGGECLPRGTKLTSWQGEGTFPKDGFPQGAKTTSWQEKGWSFWGRLVSLGELTKPPSGEKIVSPRKHYN